MILDIVRPHLAAFGIGLLLGWVLGGALMHWWVDNDRA